MEAALFPYAVGFIGGLLMILCSILGWVGISMNKRLTELTMEVSATNATLNKIERDLRGELSQLDRRVTRVESQCRVQHERDNI